jgi:hypothetical protein
MIKSDALQEVTNGLVGPAALAKSLNVFLDWEKIGETNKQ